MDKTSRLIAKGLKEEKRERLTALEIKVDRLIKDLSYYLYNLDGIEAMRVEHAQQAMEELVAAVREFKSLTQELKELDR